MSSQAFVALVFFGLQLDKLGLCGCDGVLLGLPRRSAPQDDHRHRDEDEDDTGDNVFPSAVGGSRNEERKKGS